MVFIFYSPLIFYIAYLLTLGFSYHFLALGTFLVILWEVFYFQGTSDLLVFSTTSLIVLQLIRFKYESKVLSSISILFLIFCFTFGIFGYIAYAEKIISWLYIFLSLTVGLTFYEMQIKNTLTLKLSDVKRTIFCPQVSKNSALDKIIS